MDVLFLACVKKAEQSQYRVRGGIRGRLRRFRAQFTSFGENSVALREGGYQLCRW